LRDALIEHPDRAPACKDVFLCRVIAFWGRERNSYETESTTNYTTTN